MATFKAKMKRRNEMLLPNHVALMRDDITTLAGTIRDSSKDYTFKVPRELAATIGPGDFVIGGVRGRPEVVEVTEVHDHPKIDPHAPFYYRWVTMKVDTRRYHDLAGQDERDLATVSLMAHEMQWDPMDQMPSDPDAARMYLKALAAKAGINER